MRQVVVRADRVVQACGPDRVEEDGGRHPQREAGFDCDVIVPFQDGRNERDEECEYGVGYDR